MKNRAQILLDKLRDEYNALKRSQEYYYRRCEILETVLSIEAGGLKVPGGPTAQETFFESYMRSKDGSSCSQPKEFADVLLHESECNRALHPMARRWSLLVLSFCFLVRCMGSKAYEYFRSVITLPAKSTLLRHFAAPVQAWKECLLNIDKVHSICDLFRRVHSLDASFEVDAVLGIDAMSMEPVSVGNMECPTASNSVFLFYLMPLACQLKSIAVHLMPRTKGNAGPDVIATAQALKDKLRQHGIHVRYLATDGDSGYKCLYDNMLKAWWPSYMKHGLDGVASAVESCECPILGDLLHMLKNARARLIGNVVSLSLDGSFSFTAADMNKVLQLGLPLTDKTSKGKMRDRYALEIFSLSSFTQLVAEREWVMAFYVLPYALWTAVVRYPGLSTQMRRELLNLVFDVFVYHISNIDKLDQLTVSQNRTEHRVQYCCSKAQCVRILNTLVAQLIELTRSPGNLAMGRLGTHGLECQFGAIRLLCHNKHTWKMISRAFAKLNIIKDIAGIFGRIHTRERETVAGVKITEDMGAELLYNPVPALDVNHLYDCVHVTMMQQQGLCDPSVGLLSQEMSPELEQIACYFTDFERECQAKGNVPARVFEEGPSSNNGILARLISFHSQSFTEDDSASEGSMLPSTMIQG